MYKYIFMLAFLFTFKVFSCENIQDVSKLNKENKLSIWLGNNSEFSKTFAKAMCVLDRQLKLLPLEKKKLITKLIAKSYEYERHTEDKYYSF